MENIIDDLKKNQNLELTALPENDLNIHIWKTRIHPENLDLEHSDSSKFQSDLLR